MMTYKLITGTVETLAKKVNGYLDDGDGWTLFGSPFVTGAFINTANPDITGVSQDPEIVQAIYTR